jgi:hypothetical protein
MYVHQGARLLIRAHDVTAAVSNGNSNGGNVPGTTAHSSSSSGSVENLTAAHFVLHVSRTAYSNHATAQHHHSNSSGTRSRSSSVGAVKTAPTDSMTTAVNSTSSSTSSSSSIVMAKIRRHSLKHLIMDTQMRSGNLSMMNSSSANNKHTLSSLSSYSTRDIELDLQCTTPYERSRWQLALLLAVHGSNGSGFTGSLTVSDVNRVLRGATQTAAKQQVQEVADAVITAASDAAADLHNMSNVAQLSTTNISNSNSSDSSSGGTNRAFGLTALAIVRFNSKRRNRQHSLRTSVDEHFMQQQQQQQWPTISEQ